MHWQERDAAVIGRAGRHVCTTRHFLEFFPSKTTAYRRTETLRNQGRLRLVGNIVVNDSGRPERVFCNAYKPKYDQLRHELLLTDFLLKYPEADVLRGWAVNRRLRPDAEMTLDDYFYYVELDTGEQSYAQIRRRQARYSGVEDFLLYVTSTEKRRDGLRNHTHEAVRSIALFTTLDAALRDPRGEIWIDCQGERTAI
jgi:hypothetical protein